MKLFFLIVCHKVTPTLNYNLKKFSAFKDSTVLVHIDKTSCFGEEQLIKANNISYIQERIDVKWGHISQVQVTYNMLLEIKDKDYDYVSLMSGEDIFIRSESEFISFLCKHKNKEFLGIQKINNSFYTPTDRFRYRYPSFFFNSNPNRVNNIKRRVVTYLFRLGFFKNKNKRPYTKFYKGSNWFTISKGVATLMLNEIDDKDLLNFFQKSFCIDEVIFQTIFMNKMNVNNIYLMKEKVNDNKMSLRYINWNDGPEYPKVLKEIDLKQEFEHDTFFVRKVSSDLDETDIEKIFDNG